MRNTSTLLGLCIFFFAFCWLGNTNAAGPEILLHSKVVTDGDFITLPVQISGKQYSFLVDTGSTGTVLHSSFKDSLVAFDEREPLGKVRDGQWSKRYLPPSIKVMGTEKGTLVFPKESLVRCIDLTEIRRASDQSIDGVLGMDFLNKYTLRLDLAEGTLQIIDSDSLNAVQHDGILQIDMVNGRPCVHVQSFKAQFWALVDTGALLTVDLQPEVHRALTENGQLKLWRIKVDDEGTIRVGVTDEGWLKELRVGPFKHNLLATNSAESISLLGLNYWRRYRVTFDFPRKRAYLDKGPLFDMFDESGHSGIYVQPAGGNEKVKVVTHIVEGCFADRNNVKVGDRVIAINGKGIEELSVHGIQRRLSDRRTHDCVLQLERHGRSFSVTLPTLGDMTTADRFRGDLE